jgi:hypothetical protein
MYCMYNGDSSRQTSHTSSHLLFSSCCLTIVKNRLDLNNHSCVPRLARQTMELRLLRIIVGTLLLGSALSTEPIAGQHQLRSYRKLTSCDDVVSNDECEEESPDEDESALEARNAILAGSTGDRVSNVDTSTAQCLQGVSSAGMPIRRTRINFFYTVESAVQISSEIILDIGAEAYEMIRPAILWCTMPVVDVGTRSLGEDDQARK